MEKYIIHVYSNEKFDKELSEKFENNGYSYKSFNQIDNCINWLKKNKSNVQISFIAMSYYNEFVQLDYLKFFREIKNIGLSNVANSLLHNNIDKTELSNYLKIGFTNYCSINLPVNKISENILNSIDKPDRVLFDKYSNLSIVILEDEEIHQLIAKKILEHFNIINYKIYNSAELFFNKPQQADIFLVDIIMDKTSGISAISRLRIDYPKSTIIVVSSLDNEKITNTTFLQGADDFIIKPLTIENFEHKILSHFKHLE